jgi:hypothetical protein
LFVKVHARDVAAHVAHVAAEVPAAPLIEIPAERPDVSVRLFAAPLEPAIVEMSSARDWKPRSFTEPRRLVARAEGESRLRR